MLQLVVDGRANKVIALDLGLSERTVEVHRGNIMDKMGAQSLAHLVRMHMIIQSSRGPRLRRGLAARTANASSLHEAFPQSRVFVDCRVPLITGM